MSTAGSESTGSQTKPAQRLRLPLIAFGVGLLLIASLGWQSFSASQNRPAMLTAEPNDFVVQAESESDHWRDVTVQLKNAGGHPLRILGVETTCGCTQAEPLEITELRRGMKVPLQLQLQLPTPGSEKQVAVSVRTDAPDKPETIIRLIMKGQPLDPPYLEEVRPEFVRATAAVPGTVAKAQVTVLSYEKFTEEPSVVGFDATIPDVEAELLERTVSRVHDDGTALVVSRFELSVPAPDAGTPELRGTLTPRMRTTSTKKVRPVALAVALTPPIRAIPQRVLVSLPEGSKPLEKETTVILRRDDEESWEITDIRCSADWCNVATLNVPSEEADPLLKFVLQPQNVVEWHENAALATVDVQTTHKDYPRLQIPVTIRRSNK